MTEIVTYITDAHSHSKRNPHQATEKGFHILWVRSELYKKDDII